MIIIKQEDCIACGFCSKRSPEFFTLDENGYAFIKKSPKSLDEPLIELIKKCPSDCIFWENA